MDDLTAINVARQFALYSEDKYNYLPSNDVEASNWNPHQWVVEAIQYAYELGLDRGFKENNGGF